MTVAPPLPDRGNPCSQQTISRCSGHVGPEHHFWCFIGLNCLQIRRDRIPLLQCMADWHPSDAVGMVASQESGILSLNLRAIVDYCHVLCVCLTRQS